MKHIPMYSDIFQNHAPLPAFPLPFCSFQKEFLPKLTGLLPSDFFPEILFGLNIEMCIRDRHGADCPDRTEETALIQLKRNDPKIREQNYTKCLIAGYNKIGVSNRGESSGVFYGCRAVLTPDRENKRQNGRRFKECGEPAFCLNTQDKHGVYLCACDSCEHALPVKQAKKFDKSKSENKTEMPLGCGRIRKLTPRECWRLQGFSDDMFDKAAAVNSDAQLYKQAGNGVTIPVVYAVGKRIVEIQNELNKEAIKI